MTNGRNGKKDAADSRAQGDSIEVEFQELLKINKVDTSLDDISMDSIEQEHDEEDSLFKSFTEDEQQKQTPLVNANEPITLSPELPRISIHVASQTPGNKRKKAKKLVPNHITESLVTTVDVQKKQTSESRISNYLSCSDDVVKSSEAKQHKPTIQQQNRGSRVLNILQDLDTTSITASSRASARTSSDGSSYPFGLNTSSCSISTTSFPVDPTPSTAQRRIKAIENKKNRKKLAQKPLEYFAADEISIIDDGGCEGPSIPELLTAFSKSEFTFNNFSPSTRNGGTGERELRVLPDTARDRSLLSVDSSEFDNIGRIHSLSSSSSSSFGCSSRNDDRRSRIPKSISTPNLASKLIEKSDQEIQTTTIETSLDATPSPLKECKLSEKELINITSRSSRKRLKLWKLPMLSLAASPSIDSEDVSASNGQQLQEQLNISVEISKNDFSSLNRSIPVDLDDPVSSDDTEVYEEVKIKDDASTILKGSEHLAGHGIGETVLEDCGSAIEATISEQDIHTHNKDLDMMSSGGNDDNKTEDTRKVVQSSPLSSSIHNLENQMKLLDTNVMNDNAEAQSDASTDYCSFKGDDEVMTENNDDQLSLDTTAWATKVHHELERIAEIVRLIDSKSKIEENNEKVPLDNRGCNSRNVSNAGNENDNEDDDYDDNSKQHQMSTTSEVRESRQFTKYSKQSALLNEQMLLDSSQSLCSENESFEQYDYFSEATYNRNNVRPRIGRRLRVAFGGCLKSRAQSSLTSWNGTNSTYAGTTVRMANKKSKIETIYSNTIPSINGTTLDHTADDDDCSSTHMMKQGLLLKTDSDHIRKYLVDSEHSGTSDKSCFRRPKWRV